MAPWSPVTGLLLLVVGAAADGNLEGEPPALPRAPCKARLLTEPALRAGDSMGAVEAATRRSATPSTSIMPNSEISNESEQSNEGAAAPRAHL